MSHKICQIIEDYKCQKASLSEIKSRLEDLLNNSESKIQAQSLLALLFNDISRSETKKENQEYVLAVINGTIQNPGEKPKKENILIYKDKIIATSSNLSVNLPKEASGISIIDAQGLTITPGLIDQHIHGGYGCDFNQSSAQDMINLAKELPKHGITSIIPTIMTAPEFIIKEQINRIKEAKKNLPVNSTKFLGIHLEGPYLCTKYKGIQPESEIITPSVENFKTIEDPEIKIVSYSPELDKNFELTKYLADKNIIPSAGHTSASLEEIQEAVKYGLKQITHLFNAMTPLHHRNPGIIGEALTNDNLYVEVIADGLHINPVVIDIILRTKPDSRVIFISDSLPLNQSKADSAIFGGQKIFKKDNQAVNADGTLAGSLTFLDSIIKNLNSWYLSTFSNFLKYASLNIAQNLNKKDLGYIDKDKTADLVLWDLNKNYQINMTIINGQIAFNDN